MERLINRRQQGDLGEISAIEWLTAKGATVFVPIGHSPNFDLVAEVEGRLLRVQVKTSVFRTRTPDGHGRWSVAIATNGGNQSWNRVSKMFDPTKVDSLFVLVGDGRRWLIPASAIEARGHVTLGGPKYSEFEIDIGRPIETLVYGERRAALESKIRSGEYPSGQRTAPVKRQAYAFAGSNPASPIITSSTPVNGQGSGKRGRPFSRYAKIWGKRRLTIPRHVFEAAQLRLGDQLRAHADGDGRVILERIDRTEQPLSLTNAATSSEAF